MDTVFTASGPFPQVKADGRAARATAAGPRSARGPPGGGFEVVRSRSSRVPEPHYGVLAPSAVVCAGLEARGLLRPARLSRRSAVSCLPLSVLVPAFVVLVVIAFPCGRHGDGRSGRGCGRGRGPGCGYGGGRNRAGRRRGGRGWRRGGAVAGSHRRSPCCCGSEERQADAAERGVGGQSAAAARAGVRRAPGSTGPRAGSHGRRGHGRGAARCGRGRRPVRAGEPVGRLLGGGPVRRVLGEQEQQHVVERVRPRTPMRPAPGRPGRRRGDRWPLGHERRRRCGWLR